MRTPDTLPLDGGDKGNLRQAFDDLTEGATSYGAGVAPRLDSGAGLTIALQLNSDAVFVALSDSEFVLFAEFVNWWRNTRSEAIVPVLDAEDLTGPVDYAFDMGLLRDPWPSELRRSYTIALFRIWAYDSDIIPSEYLA
jgi:hypothetical protein